MINRRLAREDRNGEWEIVGEDRIGASYNPTVILGDPGMGKTVLMRRLCERPGVTCMHAPALVRAEDPDSLSPDGDRIVVDGLDEIAASGTGSAVETVLTQLFEMGGPHFVLSCREAEWRGGADRARIEDECLDEPETLHLLPLGIDEARAFLSREFPGIDSDRVLDHAANRGTAHLCGNPLTLRLLGEAAREGGALPDTRTGLFARACRSMVGQDTRSGVVRLVSGDGDELLLASGAICATLLLCDLMGIHDGARGETPAGFLNVGDIDGKTT